MRSLRTVLVGIGSLFEASLRARIACSSDTPPTSNNIFPGRTTAAQYSLAAFPPPILTSAGFLLTGYQEIPLSILALRAEGIGLWQHELTRFGVLLSSRPLKPLARIHQS